MMEDYDVLGLFMNNEDGYPLLFSMGPIGEERKLVKQLVEQGGGILFDKIYDLRFKDNCIRLVTKGVLAFKSDQDRRDIFDYKYVLDCARAGHILPNLRDYRLNAQSQFGDYDPVQILMGRCKWSTLPKTDGESSIDALGEAMIKGWNGRYNYSKHEQLEILEFIIKNKAYRNLTGNKFWKQMEGSQVCKGRRSWQSMKEHFRKQIINKLPQFAQFGVTERRIRKMKACFKLDARHSSDESTDEEEMSEAIRKKFRPSSENPLVSDNSLSSKTFMPLDNKSSFKHIVPDISQTKRVFLPLENKSSSCPPFPVNSMNNRTFLLSDKKSSSNQFAPDIALKNNNDSPLKHVHVARDSLSLKNAQQSSKQPIAGISLKNKRGLTLKKRTASKQLWLDDSFKNQTTEIVVPKRVPLKAKHQWLGKAKVVEVNQVSSSNIVSHKMDIRVSEEKNSEELLDQSQFTPPQQTSELTPPHRRKKRLNSVVKHDVSDDSEGSVDMFEDTPPRRRKKLRLDVSMIGTTLEFAEGLKQVDEESGETKDTDGAVTSTQKNTLDWCAEIVQDGQAFEDEL